MKGGYWRKGRGKGRKKDNGEKERKKMEEPFKNIKKESGLGGNLGGRLRCAWKRGKWILGKGRGMRDTYFSMVALSIFDCYCTASLVCLRVT